MGVVIAQFVLELILVIGLSTALILLLTNLCEDLGSKLPERPRSPAREPAAGQEVVQLQRTGLGPDLVQ